jgi:hypothetical protein
MLQTETKALRPIYVARFLAVSRLCLFVNFANLATRTYRKPVAKASGRSIFQRFFGQ